LFIGTTDGSAAITATATTVAPPATATTVAAAAGGAKPDAHGAVDRLFENDPADSPID
jgi:hypothetical protein